MLKPITGKRFVTSRQSPDQLLGLTQLPMQWVLGFLVGGKSVGPEATTHHHLEPTLRISGVVPLLPLCVFMVQNTGKHFYFLHAFDPKEIYVSILLEYDALSVCNQIPM